MNPRWPATLFVALVLLAAACGGGTGAQGIASLESDSGDATATTEATSTTVDREQAMLDFAQCMRDNGVDMPDPTMDENGNFQMMRPGSGEGGSFDPADREATQAARQACSQYLQGFAQQFDRPDNTEMQDLMLQYAACMREHGVDMPDPDFSSSDNGPGGRLGFGQGDFDPSDPTFQAANEACQSIFGANGMPGFLGGGGPGGGFGGGTPPDGAPGGGTPPTTTG